MNDLRRLSRHLPADVPIGLRVLRSADISVGRFAEYMGISRQAAIAYVEEESVGDEASELPVP